MSTRDIRNILLGCFAALLMAAAPAPAQDTPAAGAQPDAASPVVSQEAQPAEAAPPSLAPSAPAAEGAAPADPAASAAAGPGVSVAELYFRRGVDLYKRDLYREALTEFNRALALDPNHTEARRFQEKANTQLQQTLVGADAAAQTPAFESLDPDTIRQQGETVQLSADEIRKERIKNLLETAVKYMEAERYKVAVEIYSNVLLIDPNNPEAKEGLHNATIGAHHEGVTESAKGVDEDRAMIRKFIEDSKRLPEGSDARGIKPYRFSVPEIEEEYEEIDEKSPIETVLESPVSIEFEDIHISEIMTFVQESWDVNVVIDTRAVEPPKKVQPQAAGAAPGGAPGAPPFGGPPGAFPGAAPGAAPGARPNFGAPQPQGGMRMPANNNPYGANQGGVPGGAQGAGADAVYGVKSSGIVPYINLKGVTLREAIQALLRPLGLDFAVQPGFIWISKPDIIRRESFEKLETRYYELRNAGSETLYKLVLRNRFGGISSMGGGMGGMGGGMMGGMGGGMMGGGMGGYGGGMGGGMMGGMGGMGGYGGGMGGGMMGGMMGGMGGGRDVTSISNISDLFSSINDAMVGEIPATTGSLGLRSTGTGATSGRNQAFGGGGYAGAQNNQAGLGAGGTSSFGIGSDILSLLERLVPQVFEPYTEELLSDMIYNPANNMLIVKNTPTNLDTFEKQLAQIDVTPKQVSIEAKFLTIRLDDLKKIGFKWDLNLTDQNQRAKPIDLIDQNDTYSYDINGDGVDEEIPFYTRPDGSRVYNNTISDAAVTALTNPASSAVPTFSILGNVLNNGDGDALNVTFDYLDSLDESELLSAPRVTTMNRKPAVVADFATEYFVSSIDTQIYSNVYGLNGGTNTNFVQNIRPVAYNFGIALSVTPQIRDNDQVRLWLNPEVRTKTGSKTFEQKQVVNGNEIENELVLPTTSWQAVWTNVIVHDGDTLVLGGLVQDKTSKGTQKLPYVADIPVIGFFFQGKNRETKQSSLLIFVTPDIIDSTGARFFDVGGEKAPEPTPLP